jgi:hypothetical protein
MIYFLVNNNYHMIDVYEHCANIKDYEKSLIQIPHTLECIDEDENFRNIYTFKSLLNGIKSFFHFFKIKKIEKQIKFDLQINKFDILFVYTEYEVLNQYIMNLFKNAGAKVFVLNEGLATYVTYCARNESKFTLKERVQLIYFKYILKYKFVEFLKYNNMLFPQINELFINGVLLYLDVKIDRNIQKYVIEKSSNFLSLNKNKAIFLNEKMYDHYCSITEHIGMLENCLMIVSNKFETVYFKFHPRETEDNRKWQIDVINKFHNVQIIQENGPMQHLKMKKHILHYILLINFLLDHFLE